MSLKKIGLIAASAVAVGGLGLMGSTMASAAAPTPTPSTSAGTGRGDHTPVTGDEAAKVTAAVTAKDSAVTVTSVRKDPDGSYDVFGTKAGAQIKFDVSADLKTITAGKAGHGGGRGGSKGTAVTGAEATKVTAAVTAKDSAVSVTSVRKDTDGSYDVFGTKAGAQIRYEVSADLKTITAGKTGHGGRGRSNDTPVTGAEATKVTAAVTAKDSAVTVTSVRKDPDGSYDVFGTKAGAQITFDVSADLKTITEGKERHGGRPAN